MKISSEFSKYAKDYSTYNIIQEKVVKKLLHGLNTQPKRIVDLGCGSGSLIKSINWKYDYFLGVDFASGMLELHPKSASVECINADFNDTHLFDTLDTKSFEHIFSSSSLQWSESLDSVFSNIARLKIPISLSLFTSGTFFTLLKTAKLESVLESAQIIENLANKYFDVEIELVHYKLEFDSVREMFRYIKKSGVSGGRNVLDYKQTKKLMNEYSLSYLEFEVIFIRSR